VSAWSLQAIEFGQYEEAFEIYKKFGKKVDAVQVLLTHCKDLDRAHDYANKVRRWLRGLFDDMRHRTLLQMLFPMWISNLI
jgi:clathrin heavy chain